MTWRVTIEATVLCLSMLAAWWALRRMKSEILSVVWTHHERQRIAGIESLEKLRAQIDGLHEPLDDLLRRPAPTCPVTQISALAEALYERLEQERKLQSEIGVFLPDDAQAAELERTLRATEDRRLNAAGHGRFSALPSKDSPGRSRPGNSSPPTRRSGGR